MDFKARTLDQILAELNPSYAPQEATIRKRQSLIPQTVNADIKEAESAQKRAYEDIVGGARRRGIGFSGIPLGEQAQYASNVFAPEVLRARARGSEQALSLEEALLGVQERRRSQAELLRQAELDRQTQAEQFRAQLAAQERQARASAAAQAQATLGNLAQYLNPQNTQNTNNVDAEEERYRKWLASQLKVSTAPQNLTVTGSQSRFGSGGTRLQGGGVPLGSGGLRLQGAGATNARLAPRKTVTGLRVT